MAAMGPTTDKCVQCILVYDLLKYFHDSVIGVDTEQAILQVIGEICYGGSIVGIFLQNFVSLFEYICSDECNDHYHSSFL